MNHFVVVRMPNKLKLSLLLIICFASTFFSNVLQAKEIAVVGLHDFIDNLEDNTTFVFKSVLDLKGRKVEMPRNCSILVQCGKITNGSIIGKETKLSISSNSSLGVCLSGTWISPKIDDLWFDEEMLEDNKIMMNINSLQSDSIDNLIYLHRNYEVDIDRQSLRAFVLHSNTSLYIYSVIRIRPNDYPRYGIIDITNRTNVSVSGGRIVGDVGQHRYLDNSTHEWGMGLNIVASCNVTVQGTSVSLCTGDGLYLGGYRESSISDFSNACKDIVIDNVVCDMNRRQGASIVHAKGVSISNSVFSNTGQIEFINPGHGIDIEPNITNGRNMSVSDVFLNGCLFFNNKNSDISTAHYINIASIPNITNVVISNCKFSNDIVIRSGFFKIKKSSFPRLRVYVSSHNLGNIDIEECTLNGGLFLHSSPQDVNNREYIGVLNAIVFKGCVFANQEANKGNSILNFSGDISRVKSILFEKCVFYISSKVFNKKLLNKERNEYVFRRCKFL